MRKKLNILNIINANRKIQINCNRKNIDECYRNDYVEF